MKINRIIIYLIGTLILALGLTLNIKCSLGTSAIVSVSAVISNIMNIKSGDAVLLEYMVFVVLEIIVHVHLKVDKKVILLDIMQLPFSLVFTRFMNLFADIARTPQNIVGKFIMLFVAMTLTAVGASLMIYTDIVYNPGDGIVKALSGLFNKEVGYCKNLTDITCICVSFVLIILFKTGMVGIGIGTVISAVCIGRFMSLFGKYFKNRIIKMCY